MRLTDKIYIYLIKNFSKMKLLNKDNYSIMNRIIYN